MTGNKKPFWEVCRLKNSPDDSAPRWVLHHRTKLDIGFGWLVEYLTVAGGIAVLGRRDFAVDFGSREKAERYAAAFNHLPANGLSENGALIIEADSIRSVEEAALLKMGYPKDTIKEFMERFYPNTVVAINEREEIQKLEAAPLAAIAVPKNAFTDPAVRLVDAQVAVGRERERADKLVAYHKKEAAAAQEMNERLRKDINKARKTLKTALRSW